MQCGPARYGEGLGVPGVRFEGRFFLLLQVGEAWAPVSHSGHEAHISVPRPGWLQSGWAAAGCGCMGGGDFSRTGWARPVPGVLPARPLRYSQQPGGGGSPPFLKRGSGTRV